MKIYKEFDRSSFFYRNLDTRKRTNSKRVSQFFRVHETKQLLTYT